MKFIIILLSLLLLSGCANLDLDKLSDDKESNSNSINTKNQTKVSISTFDVVTVAVNGTGDHYINTNDQIMINIRLEVGSDSVKLENLSVRVNFNNDSEILNFENYFVKYISNNGKPIKEGYLSNGDLIEISFNSPFNIGEKESFELRILSKNGGFVKPIYLTTPSPMTRETFNLYP